MRIDTPLRLLVRLRRELKLARFSASLSVAARLVFPVALRLQFFFQHAVNGAASAHMSDGITEIVDQPFGIVNLHGRSISDKVTF